MSAPAERAAAAGGVARVGVRAFRLNLVPAPATPGEGDRYGIRLEEAYADGERTLAATVASATPLQASRVLDAVVAAVRGSGHQAGVLSATRKKPVPLDEAAGVRLALTLLAAQPVSKPERIQHIVAGVSLMSTEETYYLVRQGSRPGRRPGPPRPTLVPGGGVVVQPSTPVDRLLIQDWLPVAELSIESRRERGAVHALPPLSFLHVWWARRPLVASAAVVLGGLLPSWSPDLAAAFPDAPNLRSEHDYRRWFMRLIGIWGNPVAAQRASDQAKASGVPLSDNPFTYRQAYRNAVPLSDIQLLHAVLTHVWGELPRVADPTAGGGSIPFTSARLGLPTYANDLNGVAASVLTVGVKLAAERGLAISQPVTAWGQVLVERVNKSLAPFFPCGPKEQVANYIWVNAISCPQTGRLIPLLPDKWLRKSPGQEVAVDVITSAEDGTPLQEPRFRVVHGASVSSTDANRGYTIRGAALRACPADLRGRVW